MPAGLLSQWISAAERQTASLSMEDLQERLRYILAADWPERVLSENMETRIVLSRRGIGDRVPGVWIRGEATCTHRPSRRSEAARQFDSAAQHRSRPGGLFSMIDAYQTGSAVAPRKQVDPTTPEKERREEESRSSVHGFQQERFRASRAGYTDGISLLEAGGRVRSHFDRHWRRRGLVHLRRRGCRNRVNLVADMGDFRGEDRDFIQRFLSPEFNAPGD